MGHGVIFNHQDDLVAAPWLKVTASFVDGPAETLEDYLQIIKDNNPPPVPQDEERNGDEPTISRPLVPQLSSMAHLAVQLIQRNVILRQKHPHCRFQQCDGVLKLRGTRQISRGYSTTHFLMFEKQRYFCEVESHGFASEAIELYEGPVHYIKNRRLILTKGMEQLLKESFLARTCLADVQYEVARLFRARFVDELSLLIRAHSHRPYIERLQGIISATVPLEFAQAFKAFLPQRTTLRHLIYGFLATYWAAEIRETLDRALWDGIDIEGTVLTILLGIDGHFKSMTAARLNGASVTGVTLTFLNQRPACILEPVMVPVENGEMMVECLQPIFQKLMAFGLQHGITEYRLVLTIDDVAKHKNLPVQLTDSMHQMEDSMKISLVPDTESLTSRTKKSSELRKCGMHRTKRWRPICSFHPDHALCLKILEKCIFVVNVGLYTFPNPN